MRVVIAGGSGFLGHALTRQLLAGGHRVSVLTRGEAAHQPGVNVVLWHPNGRADIWARTLDGADVVVNLAGASIAGRRWTAAHKRIVHESRIQATESLVAAVAACRYPPSTFIQGSAVGYYGATRRDRRAVARPASPILWYIDWMLAGVAVTQRQALFLAFGFSTVLGCQSGVETPSEPPTDAPVHFGARRNGKGARSWVPDHPTERWSHAAPRG